MKIFFEVIDNSVKYYWGERFLYGEEKERFFCKCRIARSHENYISNGLIQVFDSDSSQSNNKLNYMINSQSENDGIDLNMNFIENFDKFIFFHKNFSFRKSSKKIENFDINSFAWAYIVQQNGDFYVQILINLQNKIAQEFKNFIQNYRNHLLSDHQNERKHRLYFSLFSRFPFSKNLENGISVEEFLNEGAVCWFDNVMTSIEWD